MARVEVARSGAVAADDVASMLLGAAFFGSGGGGSFESGGQLAGVVRRACGGDPVGIVALADLPDRARVAVPASFAGQGASASIDAAANAFRALGERTGDAFDAVVPADLTVHGMLTALGVAASCGVPVVDAAGSVRAAHRFDMTTWAAAGVVPRAVVMADPTRVVVIDTDSTDDADSAARAVLAGSTLHGPIGGASWAMRTATLQRSSFPDAVSAALAAGRAASDAWDRGADPAGALAAAVDRGVVVGRGKLGEVTVTLTDRGERVEARIDTTEGSFHICSLDSHIQLRSSHDVLVGAPDLIAVVTTEGIALDVGQVTSPEFADIEVAIVVAPSPDLAPAVLPRAVYNRAHATFGIEGPVPFGIHHLDR